MAITLTLSASATYNNNNEVRRTTSANAQSITVTGNGYIENTQLIGTDAGGEALVLGEVGTPGWCRFQNLDDTNFVEIGFDDTGFVTFLKLLANEETGWMRISQAAPYARADTANVRLNYTIIEE